MSLTGLAGNMLTADDEEDKAKKAQAAAKAKKQHQRKQKRKVRPEGRVRREGEEIQAIKVLGRRW